MWSLTELLASTLSLLRDDDPHLFRKLWDAQGQLWLIASDPMKFLATVDSRKRSEAAFQRQGWL